MKIVDIHEILTDQEIYFNNFKLRNSRLTVYGFNRLIVAIRNHTPVKYSGDIEEYRYGRLIFEIDFSKNGLVTVFKEP